MINKLKIAWMILTVVMFSVLLLEILAITGVVNP